jgi:hypothetical protein
LFNVVEKCGNCVFEDNNPLPSTAFSAWVESYAPRANKVFMERVVVKTPE